MIALASSLAACVALHPWRYGLDYVRKYKRLQALQPKKGALGVRVSEIIRLYYLGRLRQLCNLERSRVFYCY